MPHAHTCSAGCRADLSYRDPSEPQDEELKLTVTKYTRIARMYERARFSCPALEPSVCAGRLTFMCTHRRIRDKMLERGPETENISFFELVDDVRVERRGSSRVPCNTRLNKKLTRVTKRDQKVQGKETKTQVSRVCAVRSREGKHTPRCGTLPLSAPGFVCFWRGRNVVLNVRSNVSELHVCGHVRASLCVMYVRFHTRNECVHAVRARSPTWFCATRARAQC